jgi:hypothetical protein
VHRGNRIENAGDSLSGKGEIRFKSEVLTRAVVTDGEYSKASIRSQSVVHKVQRPALVGSSCDILNRSTAQRELAPDAFAHLKTGSAVDPADALMVVQHPITPQQDNHPRQAIPAMLQRKCHELGSQRLVIAPGRIMQQFTIDANPATDRAFLGTQPFSYGLHRGFALSRP